MKPGGNLEKIIEGEQFDVFGLVSVAELKKLAPEILNQVLTEKNWNKDNCAVILVGMASTPDQSFDSVRVDGDRIKFFGYGEYLMPKVKSLINHFKEKGYDALTHLELQSYNIKLPWKQIAVMAGLGYQGKSTLVIHPKFGPWIRYSLLLIHTNKPLGNISIREYKKEESPLCGECNSCVDACQSKALDEYICDRSKCLRQEQYSSTTDKELISCIDCLLACPYGSEIKQEWEKYRKANPQRFYNQTIDKGGRVKI